ncbi:MAG: DUF6249 domain-containing protein [Pseudomonadota bacterium]
MEPETLAILIPIFGTFVLGGVLWAYFHFKHKMRADVQDTIRAALERGQELSPELLDRMAGPQRNEDRDLRRGLISMAIGVAFVIFGSLMDDPDAFSALSGIGSFPFMVGIAYVVMWRYGSRER